MRNSRRRISSVAMALAISMLAAACSSSTVFDDIGDVGDASGAPSAGKQITGDTLPDPGANPSTIDYTLDESAAVTATIDSSGGEIVTSHNEIDMTLVIPEGAIASPTEITLTPIQDAESDLIDLTVGGAQFAPAGLALAVAGYLRLDGATLPEDLMAATWEESGGEVVRSITLPTIGGGVRIPVVHFSGAGAGSPGSGESGSSPSSKNQRGLDLMKKEWEENGHECVDAHNPAAVTALSLYVSDTRDDLIPALIKAQTDDNALMEAGRLTLNWWALPMQLQLYEGYIVCSDVVEAYGAIRDKFANEVVTRLKAGLTHALFEASRQCKARHDPGETVHMNQWVLKAALLAGIPGMGEGSDLPSLMIDLVEACANYRVELRSQLTLNADEAGRIRGTIAAVADNVPDTTFAQLYGYQGEDTSFPFGDPSYKVELPHNSDNCAYEDTSKLDPVFGLWLHVDVPRPERKVKGLDDAAPGESPNPNSDDSSGILVVEKLHASGTVIVHCDDTSVPFPIMTNFVPGWFNKLHGEGTDTGELEFDLKPEKSSTLVATYTTDEPLVDPTDPSAIVTQHTEIKVYLSPKDPGRTEPDPPPVPFPSQSD